MPIMKDAMAGKAIDMANLEVDNDMISQMIDMMDVVLLDVVLQPKVHSTPEVGQPRDEDLLYADEVDMNDKQFIFQWAVGGTSDVEKFLEKSSEYLASLSPGGTLEKDTK
jgi:hypothetical protein